MISYTPKHFSIKEFVPKDVYLQFGEKSIWFLRPELLYTMDLIRDRYGKPLTINTWSFQLGGFHNRGFRTPDCEYGAKLSMHKIGAATDFNIEDFPSEEIQSDIIRFPFIKPFEYITCVEIEPELEKTHIDLRSHNKQEYGLIILKKTS